MTHGFTCLNCGQALRQDTVVFDLLNDDNKRGTNELTLCLTEKELKHVWRKTGKRNRYVVELSWKDFLRYASNANNMNTPSLQKLRYCPQADGIKAQCDSLGLDKKRMMQAINRAFPVQSGNKRRKEPTFYREVEPEYRNDILMGLKVYERGARDKSELAPRRCNRKACGALIPDWAGECRHYTVVIIGPEKCSTAASEGKTDGDIRKTIGRDIVDYILKYKQQSEKDMGDWIADFVEENKKSFEAITVKLMRHGVRESYLTLAVVPQESGQYRVKDCFFADADAYVLCERNQDEEQTEQEVDEKMVKCLGILQEQRSRWMKFTDGYEGYAPALCIFHTVDRISEQPEGEKEEIRRIFPADWEKANGEGLCARMRLQMECRNINCYYTQLFYSESEPENSIEKAVKWILQVTGYMPIEMNALIDDDKEHEPYSVTPPICKQCPPDQPLLKRKVWLPQKWCDLCQAEAFARMYLFDNAQENLEYARSDNDVQLLLELVKKKIAGRV